MQIGVVGLGRMGGPMSARLRKHGHDVVGCDPRPDARTAADGRVVGTLAELVAALDPPRVVWVMVPAGQATEQVLAELADALDHGDLVVDGGNSDFRHAAARAAQLARRGIGFVDVGVSGGQWGWRTGYGLTAGGSAEDYERLRPALEALAAPGAVALVGGAGSGHLVKAVHNAVQYGVMQAYAEGFALLAAHGDVEVLPAMEVWQGGCSVRSFLLGQMVDALRDDPGLDGVSGRVPDSGMGRWTAEEATRLAVPTPVLSMALQARFASRADDRAQRLLAASRDQVGGRPS